jgi:hypothetical protein
MRVLEARDDIEEWTMDDGSLPKRDTCSLGDLGEVLHPWGWEWM